MSPKGAAKWQQKIPGNVFDARFDSGVNSSASRQQEYILLFGVPLEKCVKITPATGGLGQTNKSAHGPKVGFPFFAARFIENKAKVPPHMTGHFGQKIDFPAVFKNPRMMRSIGIQDMPDIVSHLVQQGEDTLTPRLVSIDQNALLTRQK
jgi:hypothetical protein